MGISNKIATKIRTAAKTEVVPLPKPYREIGAVVAAAVIRAAASTIGQLKLTSSTARGQDFLGIRESRSTYLSTISVGSVRQQGQDTWSVTLGVPTISGWAADWQVRIVLADSPADVTVHITTPATLTRDGTLVNKSAHAEFRDLVLSGLRTGALPGGAAEVAVSKAGLAAEELEPFYASVAGTVIRTSLQQHEIATALGTVPFQVADRRPDGVHWRLGTDGALALHFAEAAITDDDGARTITVHCPEPSSHNPVTDALTARRGIALLDAVARAINRFDPHLERTSAPVTTQRPAAG